MVYDSKNPHTCVHLLVVLEGTSLLEESLVFLESPALLEIANMGDVPGNVSLVLAFLRFSSLMRNFTIAQTNLRLFLLKPVNVLRPLAELNLISFDYLGRGYISI